MHEIDAVVGTVFSDHHESLGYVHPELAAHQIAFELGITNRDLKSKVEKIIFEYPTSPFIHDKALLTIQELICPSDSRAAPGHIAVWTDDYSVRVASSGIGELRRKLPNEERGRLKAVFHPDNKVSLLPSLAEDAVRKGCQRLIVVDDSLGNLFLAQKALAHVRSQAGFSFVFLSHDTDTKISYEDEILKTPSIGDLPLLRDSMAAKSLYWAIDFNGPLLNRGAYIEARKHTVISVLERLAIS